MILRDGCRNGVLNLTLNSLSEETQTSYAIVSRFCKSMGFSGFKEMRQELRKDQEILTRYSEESYKNKEETQHYSQSQRGLSL